MLHLHVRARAVVELNVFVMIIDLHRQGLTVSAIARRTGWDRKTLLTLRV